MARVRILPLMVATALALPAAANGQTYRGELAAGDAQLESGEYYDVFTIQGRRGQRVVATLTSTAFDTYLILLSPTGKDTQNDDATEGDTQRSHLEHVLDEDGEWRVMVTSFEKGETGAYALTLDLGEGAAAAAAPAAAAAAPARSGIGQALGLGGAKASGAGPRVERGELAAGDEQLEEGEYVDTYTFSGQAGQTVEIVLTSTAFDTYLILLAPSGENTQNDDDGENNTQRSRIRHQLTEAGTWQVWVTSYGKGETGPYELTISIGG